MIMPAVSSSRRSIAARRWRERRNNTSRRWSSHCCSASAKPDDARRHPVDQHVHVDGDARLELAELEELLHHHFRLDVSRPRLEHDAYVLGRLVAHVAEQRRLLFVEELGELLDEPRLLHAVGDLGDDRDPAAAARILLRPAGAQADGAAPGPVGLDERRAVVDDDAAGREIGARAELDERLDLGVGVGDKIERGVAEFGDVVGRDRRRHADRDALRAIGEQVRRRRGHDDRLFGVAGVVIAPVDALLVDALHDEAREVGEPRLGVAIGGGVIAVDVAEVALPLDQRIARGEILGEAHQRLVNRLVAVGMERPHHVADDLRAFFERGSRVEPQDMHPIEDAPVHRLEAIARVGQRAAHDGGERVSEVPLLQRLAKIDFDRLRGAAEGEEERLLPYAGVSAGGESGQGAGGRQTRSLRRLAALELELPRSWLLGAIPTLGVQPATEKMGENGRSSPRERRRQAARP